MRQPEYLSPSQLSLWYRDREGYYLQHLTPHRQKSTATTYAMTIGSSFDAYVKSAMYEHLFGKGHNPQFEFQSIFEEQVTPEHRDWALDNGGYAFECYKHTGAYTELLELVDASQQAPQFEFTIEGEVQSIPLLGKPDLRFVHKDGAHVILDWKVSGYCSKSSVSPAKNFQLIRDGWSERKAPESRSHYTSHKKYTPLRYKGLEVSTSYLEEANKTWADQIIIYSWLLGEEVGDENVIACIDQLACKATKDYPLIRVAQHRSRTSSTYQHDLMSRLQSCWTAIKNEHIFDDLSKGDSKSRCEILDRRSEFLEVADPELIDIHEYFIEQSKIYKF